MRLSFPTPNSNNILHTLQGGINLVLGVDGGGTRTRAVITDARQNVLGEGVAGPSNPLRVGVNRAAAEVRAAVDEACQKAHIARGEIAAAEVGLAGVRTTEVRGRMREALTGLGVGVLDVVTDAEIALYGASEGNPGVVVIAGTGSVCLGRGSRGAEAWAGGWGPLAGDEGSGAWIARQALQRIAQAADGRGQATAMSAATLKYFAIASVEELSAAIYSPSMTNDRIAGFGAHVIRAAQDRDGVAVEILRVAGEELGRAAATVIRKLGLEQAVVPVAYTGGVFAAGELVLASLREELRRVAPRHQLMQPRLAPALAAARMAQASLRHHLALAG